MNMNQKRKYGSSTIRKQGTFSGWQKGGRKSGKMTVGQNRNLRVMPRAAAIPRRTRRGI